MRRRWLTLCTVWPSHSQISSLSTAILVLEKARSRTKPNLGCRGGWQIWVIWWFAKKACKRDVEWAGALSWWSCSARSVIFNATVTQYTSSVNGVSLPTEYPHGRVTVHGWTVRSPLTGCQVTSRPRFRFSRYSKWLDTFRTALVFLTCQVRIWVTGYPDRIFVVFLIPIRHITRCYLITPRPFPSEVFFKLNRSANILPFDALWSLKWVS